MWAPIFDGSFIDNKQCGGRIKGEAVSERSGYGYSIRRAHKYASSMSSVRLDKVEKRRCDGLGGL